MSHKHCAFCGEELPVPRPTSWSTVCLAENNTTEPDTVGNRHHAFFVGRTSKQSASTTAIGAHGADAAPTSVEAEQDKIGRLTGGRCFEAVATKVVEAKCPYCGVPLTGMNSNPDDCLQKPSEPAPSEEVFDVY